MTARVFPGYSHLAPLREACLMQRPRQAAQFLAPALQQPPAHRLRTADRLGMSQGLSSTTIRVR